MRNLIVAFLLLTAVTVNAQWTRPAREIRTETNGWTYIPTTETNAQLVFNWLDDALFGLALDGSSWTNLPATNVLQTIFNWIDGNWVNYATQVGVFTNNFNNFLNGQYTNVQDVLDFIDDRVRTNAITNLVFSSNGTNGWTFSMTNDIGYVGYSDPPIPAKVAQHPVYFATGYGDSTGGSPYTNGQHIKYVDYFTASTNDIFLDGTPPNREMFSPGTWGQTWDIQVALNYICSNAVGTPVTVSLQKTPRAGGASEYWTEMQTVPVGFMGRLNLTYTTSMDTSKWYSVYVDWGAPATSVVSSFGLYIYSLVPE